MDTYYIGLGANLGDCAATIGKAVAALGQLPHTSVQAVSSLYATPPWGNTEQPPFINAVAKISTELQPEALLAACLQIESDLGRVRHEKWGARKIDLDLVYSPSRSVQTQNLSLPHPYLTERAFVLVPLKELAPDLCIQGKPIDTYLQDLQEEVNQISVIGKLHVPGVD